MDDDIFRTSGKKRAPALGKMQMTDYDIWHWKNYQAEHSSGVRLAQWREDALKLLSFPVDRGEILEVGCGTGDFAVHLAELGERVTATDYSVEAINIAGTRFSDRSEAVLRFETADASSLPFQNSTFDTVVSCECLEHLTDPPSALSEMHRVLRPGGSLVLTTENYSNGMIVYWLMAKIQRKPFNSGLVVQPVEQFFVFWRGRKMLQRAGFRIRKALGAHYVFFALPGCHPHAFVRERIRTPWIARAMFPFARHVSFLCTKSKES